MHAKSSKKSWPAMPQTKPHSRMVAVTGYDEKGKLIFACGWGEAVSMTSLMRAYNATTVIIEDSDHKLIQIK